MFDPYSVLGVTRNASDDEIKKAYRSLSRKYHPDANINNPNKAQAEERFKEIQAAYNQIMDERQNGSYSSGYGYSNSYSNSYSYNNYNDNSSSIEMQAAANYINARQFAAAMNVLYSIPDANRDGRWYFFAAVASQGLGNIMDARQFISRAIALEPSNFRYRQFEQSINFTSGWYETTGASYGYTRPFAGVARWCISMALLNLLCNMCCCFGI
ncbi:DnaJ domain-containing protein [Pseudobutyrivibrio sp. MD2005]|uniref:DnaJ domain-containing protein n=1 Tax=Pseudobutyrivibrio sp. MD2005 TaxID=1410616 RepID=UPI00047FE3EA|nr:J domain-containing protein [Pseudobutyrivibrio sp. MD2005]